MALLGTKGLIKNSRWTPKALPNLALWLDAADSSTIVLNGSNVSQWNDKSGNNRNATQSTPVNQPPYSASDSRANGFAGIGASSSSGLVGLITPSFTATTWTIVMSFANTTFTAFETILSGAGTSGALRVMGNSASTSWLNGGGGSTFAFASFVNGASSSTTSPLPMALSIQRFEGIATTQTWGIGFNQVVSGRTWNGAYCELIALSSTPSTSDIQKLEGYLAYKRNMQSSLPSNHPYKSSRP